jgi:hypothetical protein
MVISPSAVKSRPHGCARATLMSLQDRLRQLRDVFSVRHETHGPGYKPDAISDRLRNRILMLYADVVTGRRTTGFAISGQDNSYQFWEEMQHALATVLGQPVLSQRGTRSAVEDAIAFAQHASAADLFTFIETSFKLDCAESTTSAGRVASTENVTGM